MRFLAFLIGLLLSAVAAQAQVNTFSQDTRFCSGRPWLDITCNGADPTGAADSTSAINTTFSTAITNGWPVFFPAGTYKVTSKITVDYQGQAAAGLEIISRGATLDGRTIASGNVLQIQCSGGTVAAPVVCKNLRISGSFKVFGTTNAYVAVVGKTDFSDRHDGAAIDHLTVVNNATGTGAGAIQLNYVTGGDLWLSGSTLGGSSSVGAVAFEQVQTSKIGGYASALGPTAPGLLIENGASTGNSVVNFEYDPNNNTCVSVTSASAVRNTWLVPVFPCTTATNMTANQQNVLLGPSFVGTNMGPVSSGVAVVGRGSLNRFSAPAVSSRTLIGADDGTIFSSANATGTPTQWTAASLPVTLPDPAAVGSGWTTGFVSDNSKAVVISTTNGSILTPGGQQLTQLIVGAPNSINFEIAVLASDGSNWRILHISQGAALLNGSQTTLPANWEYPGGPGYQATQGDNGMVISSAQVSAGLTVVLPSTTAVQRGYMLGLVVGGGHAITLNVNATNGGTIVMLDGGTATSTILSRNGGTQFFQFDGVVYRQIIGSIGDGIPGAVSNNAALKALAVPAINANITRSGFAVSGDGGAANYTYSSTNCTINSGAGDNGAQVAPSSGGGCWNANFPSNSADARVWGADPTAAADSTSAITAALSALAFAKGTLVIAGGRYKITSSLIDPGAKILQNYNGNGFNTHLPTGSCPVGITIATPAITGLSITVDGVVIDGLCIDNTTVANSNTSGAGISVVGQIMNTNIRNSQVIGSCVGIDVSGSGNNPLVGALIANNTVLAPDFAGCGDLRLGNFSTNANTSDVTIINNQFYCNTAANAVAVAIVDGGGSMFTNNNNLACGIGTLIAPGNAQSVINLFFSNTVLGDSDYQHDLVIGPTSPNGSISRLNFDGTWTASAAIGSTVYIRNTACGSVGGIHFNAGSRIFPAGNLIGLDVVSTPSCPISDVTFDDSRVCAIPGSTVAAVAVMDIPLFAVRNSTIGVCDYGGNTPETGAALSITPSGQITTAIVTGNNFQSAAIPLTFVGNVSDNIIMRDNSPLDNNVPTFASNSTVISIYPTIHISGSAAIANMSPAWTGRLMMVIPSAGSTWTTLLTGNIGTTVTATPGKPEIWVFDGTAWNVSF